MHTHSHPCTDMHTYRQTCIYVRTCTHFYRYGRKSAANTYTAESKLLLGQFVANSRYLQPLTTYVDTMYRKRVARAVCGESTHRHGLYVTNLFFMRIAEQGGCVVLICSEAPCQELCTAHLHYTCYVGTYVRTYFIPIGNHIVSRRHNSHATYSHEMVLCCGA